MGRSAVEPPAQVAASFGIVALLIALALLTRFPAFLRSVVDWDESLYFMMAQSWRAAVNRSGSSVQKGP